MMNNLLPSVKFEIIHEMTNRDNNVLNIDWLCQFAGVSRSGYYYWLSAASTRKHRQARDEKDFALILEAFKFRGYDKGARGIHMRLLRFNPVVMMNVKKIRRLMRKFYLKCPIRTANPYRRLKKAMQTDRTSPNLLNREFRSHGARRILLTDITYIPRHKGRFSYLCVIMDAYTKEVLSWVLSDSLEVDFVLLAVNKLIEKYGKQLMTDALIHSDQGCHYTSTKFVDLLKDSNIRQSMSRKANCWDNSPQESFFGHMKAEMHLNPSDGHSVLNRKITDWIGYYNTDRPQWSLAKLTPKEFYRYTRTGKYPLKGVKPPQPSILGDFDSDPNLFASFADTTESDESDGNQTYLLDQTSS